MKQEKTKSTHRKDSWVDVHDDALMVELGIRQPNATPRDKTVWTKTPNEKRILRNMRNSVRKEKIHFYTVPNKSIPVWDKLIIYLKKNKTFPNTTYSTKCWMHEIGDILSMYNQYNKKTDFYDNLVVKYSYNGKTYKPEERPYWISN